jgi:hypothetical protein
VGSLSDNKNAMKRLAGYSWIKDQWQEVSEWMIIR